MRKVIFLLIAALMIPSISFAAKGGNKPPPDPGVDLEAVVEETQIELCNLYDFVDAPLPLLCLDFCGDGTQESFEGCDDGNTVDGDGCSADCTIETIDCGPLSSPTNGSVSYNSTTEGSVATYSCEPGYSLTDDSERTCGSNGTWSGSEPTCEQVPSGQQTFNSSGTFTVPQGVTTITVQLEGAGGGGGGGGNNNLSTFCFEAQGGGGGGAGGLSELEIAVTPGNNIPVTIGNSGIGGAPGSNGQAGGDTSFGSTLSALGGQGGQGGANCNDSFSGHGGFGGFGNALVGGNGEDGDLCLGGNGGTIASGALGGSGGNGACSGITSQSPGQSGQNGYAIVSW